eukprot:380064_1
MAEQAPEANKKKKGKSKFGMMMGTMGRSAKKGLSRAGKQMAKGAVKAKQTAATKIGKVPITDEDPEIISALERLKITKTETYANSDIARNLYEARLNAAIFLMQLSDKLKNLKITQNDPFTAYVQKMGVSLASTEHIQSQYLKHMEQELVIPLEQFATIDVEKVQKLKLKYKSGKIQYDIAAHKLTKAQESQDQSKVAAAQQKKDAAHTQLTNLRNDMKFEVNNLEQNKQENLLGNMQKYWTSYASFASEQSNILAENAIDSEHYVTPIMNIDNNNQNEVKNDGYDDNNNNNNNQEYNDNDNNGPTDDYNPFDE